MQRIIVLLIRCRAWMVWLRKYNKDTFKIQRAFAEDISRICTNSKRPKTWNRACEPQRAHFNAMARHILFPDDFLRGSYILLKTVLAQKWTVTKQRISCGETVVQKPLQSSRAIQARGV